MKVLMVNKFLYPKGGAETYFLKIGKYLEEHDNEVEYFGMNNINNVVGNSLNLYTQEMDFHSKGIKKILYPFKIIYSFDAKKKMKKIIKKFEPDIIHLNNINFQLTPSIIEIASKMNIPIVQTVHDYQMICPNHLLFTNNELCEKCINGSKWNCFKYNCIHNDKIKSFLGTIEAILYNKLNTYSKVTKYICPSYFIEEKLLQASEIYKNKTITIHNFVEFNESFKYYNKEDYVLFFGRLSEEKGLNIFLEVCRELPNIKFKIAGTGPLEQQCKNIDNVEYVGFKTGKELEKIIAKAKFSVYPSIWYENCPLSILESQGLGTPVISGNYGGMKELIKNNDTGILINRIDKKSLKKAILDLYSDEIKIKTMTNKCIDTKKEMISLENYCEHLIQIYNEVIGEKKK